MELQKQKNINEMSKKKISEQKEKIETLQTENYKMAKQVESIKYSMDNQETEIRRLKEKEAIFEEMKHAVTKKLKEQKEIKVKQTENYQSIIKNLLVGLKAYQRYAAVVEKSFVNSYENLLLLVDFKFDAAREATSELHPINLNPKERKLLNTNSLSLVDVINEERKCIDYNGLDNIFSKTIKDLRGRKFLDEKEGRALFEGLNLTKDVDDAQRQRSLSGTDLTNKNSSSSGLVIMNLNAFEDKVHDLTSKIADLKKDLESTINNQEEKASKLSSIMNQLKEVVGSFNGLLEQTNSLEEKPTDSSAVEEVDNSTGKAFSLKQGIQDLQNHFKTIEDKCQTLSSTLGDKLADEKKIEDSKEALFKLFENAKKQILLETGCSTVENLLKEEAASTTKELEERKQKVQILQGENTQSADQIKKMNLEVLDLEDQISKLELGVLNYDVHSKKLELRLKEKTTEIEALKEDFERQKRKATETETSVKVREGELSQLKSQLKEETDKYENLVKKNNQLADELLSTYRNKLMVDESYNDDLVKQEIVKDKISEFKR